MGARDLDDDPEETAYRTPLPKDDRLWRHPSELAESATSSNTPHTDTEPRRASRWRFKRHPQR